MEAATRILFLGTLLLSSVTSDLSCPSGGVPVPSPNDGYLSCTNSTAITVCGDIGKCEIIDNLKDVTSHQVCCIASSLLCYEGQFMYGGRCYEQADLPNLNATAASNLQQIVLQQATNCQLGTTLFNGQCLSLAAPGGSCQVSQQCVGSSTCSNSVCTCSTSNAQIINGYCIVPSTSCSQTQTLINGQCMTYAIVGNACQATSQCVGGANCVNQVCACPSNLNSMNGYCIPSPTAVSSCTTGQVLSNGQCLSISAPGSACQVSAQCVDSSTCLNSICTCSTTNARVINGYCIVPSTSCSQTQTLVNGQCVTYATVGNSCQATAQCVGGSTCNNQQCACPSNLVALSGYCVPNPNSAAVQCSNGQVLYNSQCLSLAAPGSACQVSQQCIDSSSCINSICQCSTTNAMVINGYCIVPSTSCSQTQVLINNQCTTYATVGNACIGVSQCLGGSTCSNLVCTCPSNLISMSGYCIPPPTSTTTSTCSNGQVLVNNQCLSLASPGSACQVSQQCIDSSTCSNSICRCSATNAQIINGYCIVPSTSCSQTQTLVNGQCMTYSIVGNSCQGSAQCVGGSTCVNQMCTCPSNLISMNGYCIPSPTTTTTQCNNGQVSVNGQCLSLAVPGSSCQSSLQCVDSSTCTNSICQCSTFNAQIINGYCIVPSTSCSQTQTLVNGQCMTYSIVGNSCQGSAQCVGGSTCVNQMCTCPSNLISMSGYCVPSATSSNQCGTGQVLVNGQCLSTVSLGAFCQSTAQCTTNAVCQGTCQCSSGYTQQNGQCISGSTNGCQLGTVLVNGQCLSLAAPGSQCQSSLQCIDNSACNNQQCTCSNSGAQVINGYCLTPSFGCSQTQTSVNGQCMTFAQPGASCQFSQQCVGGSTCTNQVCTCPSGTTNMYNYCISPSNAVSNPCQTGQVQVNGQCVSVAAPGSTCQATSQCLDSSTCSNSICTCSNQGSLIVSGYCVTPVSGCSNTQTRVNNQCVSLATPGQSCMASNQCVSGSSCTNSVCTCPSGRSQMNGYCVPSGGGSTGTCPSGQVLVNGVCVNRVSLGGSCQQAVQCGDNTQCSNGICSCASGYQQVLSSCVRSGDTSCQRGTVSVNGQCMSIVSPGGQCSSSLQCIDNSSCNNGICTCSFNLQAISGYCVTPGTASGCGQTQARVNNQCVTFAIVGQSCVGAGQCVGGATCNNQQCSCSSGQYSLNDYCLVDPVTGGGNCNAATQVLVNGVCYNLVQPGQQCQFSQQCIGGGQCSNGVCQGSTNGQCKSYQVTVNSQCYDTVSIGQQCSIQQQCINNAACMNSRCQCNSGFTFNGQACLSGGVSPTCSGLTVSANGACMQLVAMSQFCTTTPQCMGFSVCSSSVCTCPYAYSLLNGVCRRTTSISNCPSGQVQSPSGACLNMVGLGGSCQINEQCPSGASCSMGVCTQGSSSLTCNDSTKEVAIANGSPINCLIQLCPSDATCEMAQQQFVCCRPKNNTGSTTGYCPSGQSVELLSTGAPKNCMLQSCSSGRICQYAAAAATFVCCGSTFG